jgi:2-amino-4-hydroxy-6-hydroxymethyldihydropteridine diphosphokinase
MSGFLKLHLKERKEIIKSRNFPRVFGSKCKNSTALIGVGGNLGDCKRRFNKLLVKLQRDKQLKVLASSIIFKNPPFGYLKQDYFFNTLFLIDTKLSPIELLVYLQRVEKHFGRVRLFKDAPRTLDLDIIFYEKEKIKKVPKLIIPHPHWKDRESVTLPLKYLKGLKCLKRVL